MHRQAVDGAPGEVEVGRDGLGDRLPVDRVIDDAKARRAARCRRDIAGNRDAVLDHRTRERAAATERLFAPCDIILVEVVGVEARVEAGDVDIERVGRAELDADIGAVALAVLFEQRRADQGRDERALPAADGEGAVAEDFEPVAARATLLIDRTDEDTEGLVVILPAYETRNLRVDLARQIRIGGLCRRRQCERVEVERIARDDVDRAADPAFLDVGLRALVHFEASDDLGGQGEVVEAARRGDLVEDEPVGGRDAVAVEQRLGEVRRGAAQ